MKRKDQLDYMLRAIKSDDEYTVNKLWDYCYIHKITTDANEFQNLLDCLKNKKWIEVTGKDEKVSIWG